jgi:tRNA (mo5U34)-methyltransferase
MAFTSPAVPARGSGVPIRELEWREFMITDLEAIRRRIAQHPTWYHRIELAPGLRTPGVHDSQAALAQLDALGLPGDCGGLRVLDVGCRDGFFAFELQRRGATVVGVDYVEPTATGFAIAAEILGSTVEYVVDNVYNLSRERYGTFDLVLFLGVLYHLRNPMLALDRVRDVVKPGALVWVETQIVPDPTLASLPEPLWQLFPRDTLRGDATNKWAPNAAGLRCVLEECEFKVLRLECVSDRAWVKAEAVVDARLQYFRDLDEGTGICGRAVVNPASPRDDGVEDRPS